MLWTHDQVVAAVKGVVDDENAAHQNLAWAQSLVRYTWLTEVDCVARMRCRLSSDASARVFAQGRPRANEEVSHQRREDIQSWTSQLDRCESAVEVKVAPKYNAIRQEGVGVQGLVDDLTWMVLNDGPEHRHVVVILPRVLSGSNHEIPGNMRPVADRGAYYFNECVNIPGGVEAGIASMLELFFQSLAIFQPPREGLESRWQLCPGWEERSAWRSKKARYMRRVVCGPSDLRWAIVWSREPL